MTKKVYRPECSECGTKLRKDTRYSGFKAPYPKTQAEAEARIPPGLGIVLTKLNQYDSKIWGVSWWDGKSYGNRGKCGKCLPYEKLCKLIREGVEPPMEDIWPTERMTEEEIRQSKAQREAVYRSELKAEYQREFGVKTVQCFAEATVSSKPLSWSESLRRRIAGAISPAAEMKAPTGFALSGDDLIAIWQALAFDSNEDLGRRDDLLKRKDLRHARKYQDIAHEKMDLMHRIDLQARKIGEDVGFKVPAIVRFSPDYIDLDKLDLDKLDLANMDEFKDAAE